MKTTLTSLLLAVGCMNPSFAATPAGLLDIYAIEGGFIRVTKSADNSAVAFEYCNEGINRPCKAIGPAKNGNSLTYYRIRDLKRQYAIEKRRRVLTEVGNTGTKLAFIGTVGAGTLATIAVLPAAIPAALVVAIAGTEAIGGSILSIAAVSKVKWLDSTEARLREEGIAPQVLGDEDVWTVTPAGFLARSIREVVERLHPVDVR